MSLASTDALAPEHPAAALSRTTLMTVRRVLHAYREGWLLDGRLAAAARMVAEDARQRGLAAERMLVGLKQAWSALDEVRRMSPLDARELLSRLVALSIRAYYAPARAARRTSPAGSGGCPEARPVAARRGRSAAA